MTYYNPLTESEVSSAVSNTKIINDIYQNMGLRVSQIWETSTELQNFSIGGAEINNGYLQIPNYIIDDSNTYSTGSDSYVTKWSKNVNFTNISSINWSTELRNPDNANEPVDIRLQNVTDNTTLKNFTHKGIYFTSYSDSIDVSGINKEVNLEIQLKVSTWTGETRNNVIDKPLKYADPETPLISSTHITSYDYVNFDIIEDNETITVKVLDSSNNVLLNDIQNGEDIRGLSPDKDIKLKFILERTDTTNDPKINRAIIRWLE